MWIVNNADSAGIISEENPFSMREVTLGMLASMSNRRNNKANRAAEMREYRMIPALKSLDILRQNVQPLLNNDVDAVVKKYLDDYLLPGVNNIRNNFGAESITEAHIRELCCIMLDETKHLYSDVPFYETVTSSNDEDDFHDENMELNNDEDMEEMTAVEEVEEHQQKQRQHIGSTASYDNNTAIDGTEKVDNKIVNQFHSSRINENTFFVMSTFANKVLNCTQNRLFSRYPQLFRYCIDEEDRAWMVQHNIHRAVASSSSQQSRCYVLLLEDIRSLLDQKNDQCGNRNLRIGELVGFKLPMFILQKIQNYMDKIMSFVNNAQNTCCVSRPTKRSVYRRSRTVCKMKSSALLGSSVEPTDDEQETENNSNFNTAKIFSPMKSGKELSREMTELAGASSVVARQNTLEKDRQQSNLKNQSTSTEPSLNDQARWIRSTSRTADNL